MDMELTALLALCHSLPRVRGAGTVTKRIRQFYLRKPRPPVVARVKGFRLLLNPHEAVDGELLFQPQLYDAFELDYVRDHLGPDDWFVDLGAYFGIYALVASDRITRGGIIAVEADSETAATLRQIVKDHHRAQIRVENCGVADFRGSAQLTINREGNRGHTSFLESGPDVVHVECAPILDILQKYGVTALAGMKLDLEGLEYRALQSFFQSAPAALKPRFIIVEFFQERVQMAGGNVRELLTGAGYRLTWQSRTSANLIFERES